MKVLVACEESQRVCIAFRAKGHEAYSCDIQPCSGGHHEWHIQSNVLPLLNGDCQFETVDGVIHSIVGKWDLIIAHPPCTRLCSSGQRWLYFGSEEYRIRNYRRNNVHKAYGKHILTARHTLGTHPKRLNLEAKHHGVLPWQWLNSGVNYMWYLIFFVCLYILMVFCIACVDVV